MKNCIIFAIKKLGKFTAGTFRIPIKKTLLSLIICFELLCRDADMKCWLRMMWNLRKSVLETWRDRRSYLEKFLLLYQEIQERLDAKYLKKINFKAGRY